MRVINGNNIELLKEYPDNYFDAVVTDPPYGLGKEPNASEVMQSWVTNGYHKVGGSGFMGKCYHPDTEVLTNNGWKKISDVSERQAIVSLNPSTHKIELKPIIKKYEYDFNGELIHLKHRSAEQLVTPNHNVWCSISKGNFRLREASKLPQIFGMSNQAIVEEKMETNQILVGDKKYDANDFCFLVGMFIGDGSVCIRKGKRNDKVRSDNFISFSFKKERKIKALENILTSLKIVYNKNVSSIKNYFYINDDALVEYFHRLGKAKEKHIPKQILNLNYSALKGLYDGLIESDGCIQGIRNQHIYSTISKRLADDVQELSLKIGISASISIQREGGKKIVFGRLCETQTAYRLSMLPKDKIIKFNPREKNILKVAYSGKVHCVEISENHILYTRYNGKPVWSGNSWDAFVPQPIFWKDSNWITQEFPISLQDIRVDNELLSVESVSDRWVTKGEDNFYYDFEYKNN
jgi:intein/homing endonuclease